MAKMSIGTHKYKLNDTDEHVHTGTRRLQAEAITKHQLLIIESSIWGKSMSPKVSQNWGLQFSFWPSIKRTRKGLFNL